MWPFKKIEEKRLSTATVMYGNEYISSPRNVDAYVREGYKQNIIIYRCINEITRALSSVEIFLQKDDKAVEKNDVLRLLKKPNMNQNWQSFITQAFIEYLLTGNLFILATSDNRPAELIVLSSRNVEVKCTDLGSPVWYKYKQKMQYIVGLDGKCQVLHLKTYDPDDIAIGMSPIQPVALSADTHNAGMKWNAALLQNGARPSGVVKFKNDPGKETLERVREWFKKTLQGAKNAGEIPILTDEADFQELGLSPKDMDYLLTLKETAKYIASSLGVPLPLVDNDASSFNNIEQAKERFWTDTVLPMLDMFLRSFSSWLLPMYGLDESHAFVYDRDSIPSLEGLQAKRYDRMSKAVASGLATVNEARQEVDFDPVDGGDILLVPSSLVPIDSATSEDSQDSAAVQKHLMRQGYTPDEVFEMTGIRPALK